MEFFAHKVDLLMRGIGSSLSFPERPIQEDKPQESNESADTGNDDCRPPNAHERFLGIKITLLILIGSAFAFCGALCVFGGLDNRNRKWRILCWVLVIPRGTTLYRGKRL